jgi:hypothetical protein
VLQNFEHPGNPEEPKKPEHIQSGHEIVVREENQTPMVCHRETHEDRIENVPRVVPISKPVDVNLQYHLDHKYGGEDVLHNQPHS